jgi:hypothetical protein
MTQRGRGKRVREVVEATLKPHCRMCEDPALIISALDNPKFKVGQRVRVTVELLARTRKGAR